MEEELFDGSHSKESKIHRARSYVNLHILPHNCEPFEEHPV